MRKILFAGAAFLLPASAQAAEMSLATLLSKAEALGAKGILALGSPDIAVLKGEMHRVGTAYRADLSAQKSAGKPLHSCPPPKVGINSDEIMSEFRKIPVAQRPSMTVRTAFYGLMKRRYPCK